MPGSLSTSTAMVCFSMALKALLRCGRKWACSDEDHALFRYRPARLLVLGAEQHLVMRGARWDHREAVLRLVDRDIDDDRLVHRQHLLDDAVDIVGPARPQAHRAEGVRELDEIRQRGGVALRIAAAMQQLLPLPHH